MISPLTVTLQVTYADNEQQFLLQAVEAAVKTFRSLNANNLGEGSAQDQLTSSKPRLNII